ncbi:hypothetical protein K2173_005518 [Erythroxylum novogranatense]|uniref:CRAL-TRIO domain-containing protein n=1 Tax=Erythroxylum novogranatense TaxID=1862640 RepID=A0AAV8SKU7_9ROSI|nr:hypothetical protein K2173_005518 [Erythroxylum novogranatense]
MKLNVWSVASDLVEFCRASTMNEEDDRNTNELEQKRVDLMRAYVQREDPSSKEVDDMTMRRFLRARQLDVDKASVMLLKYLKWRREFVPNDSFLPSEIQNEIAQNKMFLQGSDRKGQPIIVVLGARHIQSKDGVHEFKRFIVYGLDKACARMPSNQEKFVVIGDLGGWGYANSDIRGYLAALSIVQDYYPERLGKVYIVHAPNIFKSVWKIVWPFIDQRTREKIVFVEEKLLKSTLMEGIEESQIPEIYGGQLPLVPIHEV